ncbi:S41 family peptidase [Parasphingopyxis lamellibrachiae]|uniref:Peptidase S41-like protein n=1 Tax=Parasphingopyxis lamellibrachiae TaxID=680125 RepID=A0A3D9FC65_9SPHN|nr:S41 family peptidase [Parasphingopyxis lamellibrachiae]RED15400.1 peptidase S41-like protein [Parasphingopyxis lamellibrachiae]
MRFILFCIAAFVLPFSSSPAQPLAPRTVAENVASLIEDNFFDETRAGTIAAEIRSASASGSWDGISEPLLLASALTEVIAPHDGHFRVTWSRPEGDTGGGAAGRRLYGFDDRIVRSGYGFRQTGILPGNIGYIDMVFFAHFDFDNPDGPAWASANAALALVSATDAVIIDLRDNGGGSPAMVGYLISAFTPPDAPIYNIFHSRSGTESEAPGVFHPAPRLDVPLYILTSARTASAAEALAYTLQAAGRATVVGEASAGGANPGTTFDAGNGFEVFISTGSPINAITGTNWEGSGVVPDIAVPSEEALRRGQLAALNAIAENGDPAFRLDREWARSALEPVPDIDQDLSTFVGDYGRAAITLDETGLLLRQGRRPVRRLVPVAPGLFRRAADPLQRYRILSDETGMVTALEILRSDGAVSRLRRD